MEISWQPPGFLGIPELSAYNILLFERHTSRMENYTIDELSYTFHGLLKGRVYTVIVAGVNELAMRTAVSEHSGRLTVTLAPTTMTSR